ncbi:velvet factor domain-containing protein [Trichoderma novae-zelandiae]
MSSAPGHHDFSTGPPGFAIEMDPMHSSRLENMPRTPDNFAMDRYSTNPAYRMQRLPPPQGLLAGAPCGPDTFRPSSQDPHQYFHPQPYSHNNTGHGVSSPLLSPSHIPYAGAVPHQSYPPRHMADPGQPPQVLPPVTTGRPENTSDPRMSQYPPSMNHTNHMNHTDHMDHMNHTNHTNHMNHMNRQTSPPRPYQHLESGVPPPYIARHEQDTPMAEPTFEPEPARQVARPPSHTPESVRPPAVRVPNLLGSSKTQFLNDTMFELKMRQQPNAARACGFGDRDRRVIDPPPIVELVVRNPNFTQEEIRVYLRYESYVMSCAIFDESGERDSSYMPEEYQHQRRLMGSLVATPFVGQDENGQEGCFFCFSDLSCRTPGSFRLKFTLMMIDPSRAGFVKHFPILAESKSEPFKVYSAKEFPGMVASSSLAKRLKEQGCIISIKKGNDRGRGPRNNDDGSDNDDDDDGEASHAQRRRRQMRS